MSTSKLLGALLGAATGLGIAALLAMAARDRVAVPGTLLAGFLLLGAFLGSGLGAFIGWDDRRRND